MYNAIKHSLLAFLLILPGLIWPHQAQSQVRINMPYSMYGVGEVRFNQYLQNMGMGGLSQGYRSNASVNDVNPASYSAFDSTSFVFETTLFSHFYEQKTATVEQQADYVAMGHLAIGFPITPRWSFAAGIKPFSMMGYMVREEEDLPLAGNIKYFYEGSGGLNQLFLGSGMQVVGGLSLGVNASYVFGNLNHESSAVSDSAGVYLTNLIHADRVTGWLYGLGLQYEHVVSENRRFTLGTTFGNQADASVRRTETLRRMLPGVLNFDTLSHRDLAEGSLTLPTYYGIGAFARLNSNWGAGFDYQWQNWDAFELLGSRENFNNSYQLSAGVRFNPSMETYSGLLSRIQYSAGVRYGQSYIKPSDEALNEFGISFGMNIPVRRAYSGINIGFEYSQRGSAEDHLMQENFYRINLGINIYERWFQRLRFF